MDPLIRSMHRISEAGAKPKMEYSEIWKWGNKISGGHGLWGSYELLDADNPKEMVRAWVDALRELGYDDIDIVLYGDWTDGRHIADELAGVKGYDEYKKIVKNRARKAADVAKQNREGGDKYPGFIKDMQRYLGVPAFSKGDMVAVPYASKTGVIQAKGRVLGTIDTPDGTQVEVALKEPAEAKGKTVKVHSTKVQVAECRIHERGGQRDNSLRNTDQLYDQLGGYDMVVMVDDNQFVKKGDVLTVGTGSIVPGYVKDSSSEIGLEHRFGEPEDWKEVELALTEDEYQKSTTGRKEIGEDSWQIYYLLEKLQKGEYKFVEDHDRNLKWLEQFVDFIDDNNDDDAHEADEARKMSKHKAVSECACGGVCEGDLNKFFDSFGEPILQATAKAYADSLDNAPEVYSIRDLNWPGYYTDAKMFVRQAKIVGRYNEFLGEKTAAALVGKFGTAVQYRLAREGSPAVYIKGVSDINTEEIRKIFDADEADMMASGELRLWWD